MKTKFIDNSKEIQMIREWGDTTCITQQREIFSDLIDTIPDLFPKLVPKINDIIGYGFVFYIAKFDHPDLQDYFKTGIAKCLKERFNDKRIRIRKIHPNVIEQKTFDFQVVGSREFETMMKRMIPHNIELEKIGVKTEGDYFPGHTEFYTMDKWDEVINLAEQEYPNYKDIVGVKRAK
tara:strand:- start:1529 stop:2062 length:534 start_codon:yes stop_codon:yes gene_type:complete